MILENIFNMLKKSEEDKELEILIDKVKKEAEEGIALSNKLKKVISETEKQTRT